MLARGLSWGGLEVFAWHPRTALSKAPPCQGSSWHLLGWESGNGFQGIGNGVISGFNGTVECVM